MENKVDTKRVIIFCAFAYGIAWLVGLVVYLTGGLQNSPQIVPGLTLAIVLVATLYMWAPTLAHILTRLVTKEGWQGTFLRPHFRKQWKYWVIAWVGPALLTLVGILVFFVVFPANFDPALPNLQKMMDQTAKATGQTIPLSPWTIVLIQTAQAILIAPLINGLFTFGEEFGWRAYLQPKLMPLGGRKAMLLMGVIWGAWHWPITLMGHNYGLNYPGYPVLGPLTMVWFTLALGTFLGWLTLKAKSVWPAVIGHAAINGIAGLGIMLAAGDTNPILGPSSAGVLGAMGFAIFALVLFFSPKALVDDKDQATPVVQS